ncbi:multicopper oxidase family protein [Streptomyces sp. NPDC017979]|uniref:multicopper oxidase family protein n=1 Tax=Streptomyces sp. NPDC017979 TaxID=3365024 RepID=UPI0037BD565A
MHRRTLLSAGALGAGVLLAGTGQSRAVAAARRLPAVSDPRYLTPIADARAVPRFVNALPRPTRLDLGERGSATLAMVPTTQDVIGGGLGLRTPVWGFTAAGEPGTGRPPASWPGPTLVANAHRPVRVRWVNALPYRHLLPVDTTVHWAFAGTDRTIEADGVPAVVHLHGGHTAADSDGHPDAWYTPGGVTGPAFSGTRFTYDNSQESATLWYHDHALGITRLNVYAGLAGFYLLRDEHEKELVGRGELPGGSYEVELAIQDRDFRPDGALAFPDLPAAAQDWPGGPSVRPEFFGQVITVNGAAWPVMDVEPRQYRLRLLNGSNSRFYRLSVGGAWPFPTTQIGTDGGFLNAPVPLRQPLLLAPGERADVVVDLRGRGGQSFDLTNDAPTPFPDGTAVSPPADRVLRLRVGLPYDRRVPEPSLPRTLRAAPWHEGGDPVRTRRLVLTEGMDQYDRPKPMLGTVDKGMLEWMDPVTETPALGTTEIWEFYNTTADAHPIHLHLVRFQVLDRASFTAVKDPETGALSEIRTGRRQPPEGGESGPKDTVRALPGQVTRVRAVFDRRGRYVWHCHMLDHEDHEMMREYEVT